MGIIKRAADLAYAFRFVKMLVTDWKNWDAFKVGLIDEDGKRIKSVKVDNDEKKSAYTPFIRLCANIKRLLSKLPGGSSKLGSFAAALYLVKEQYGITDDKLAKILSEHGVDITDILAEQSEWFILPDLQLSPGIYRIKEEKIVNSTFDTLVLPKDQIRIHDNSYPIGNIFGISIYEATHIKTNQKVYITSSEIYR
jgi:hypothetical protein